MDTKPLTSQVRIIAKEEIPAISEIEFEGKIEKLGEVRDFLWHEDLKSFLPSDGRVSFSWVKLDFGEVLAPHEHATASMIIIYKGSGQLTGELNLALKEGDVVAVPAHSLHGFEAMNQEGLYAISVQFGAGLYTDPLNPRVTFDHQDNSYEAVIKLNQQRIEQFKQCRFLKLLTDGTLDHPKKRQVYLDALQVWSNKNQDLLFARQAMVSDSYYEKLCLEHLFEEVGHDKMHHTETTGNMITSDPVIEAIASWFILQMFKSDHIIKIALIHLVIEHASDIYHIQARPILNKTVDDEYFKVHEADEAHAAMGVDTIKQLSKAQYNTVYQMVDKGWDMLISMTNRVCELVDQVKV
ncbi:hypothetical protein L3V83_07115 [Thiotrichales bacterium 19X7-9]|nr:hypothetical protein [Thiotrichales bacterium 19X7-9]